MKDNVKVKKNITIWQLGRMLGHIVRAVIIIGICFIIRFNGHCTCGVQKRTRRIQSASRED